MSLQKTIAVYFSPTHTTERVLRAFAAGTGVAAEMVDLTTPQQRSGFRRSFGADELVAVGLPVYGGRLPKHIDDFFTGLHGGGAPAVAVVVYGNRDYDDSLLELKLKLEERAFDVRAAAAFIGEHTVSNKIATGRPDANDLAIAFDFGKRVASAEATRPAEGLSLKGSYPFTAKGTDPTVCPSTSEDCQRCGVCAVNCPWGAINSADFRADATKCMRCGRCIRECPSGAKRFTDETYLARIPEFEKRLGARRCEPELFLPEFH